MTYDINEVNILEIRMFDGVLTSYKEMNRLINILLYLKHNDVKVEQGKYDDSLDFIVFNQIIVRVYKDEVDIGNTELDFINNVFKKFVEKYNLFVDVHTNIKANLNTYFKGDVKDGEKGKF